MITERTLRRWRKDALSQQSKDELLTTEGREALSAVVLYEMELNNRILALTRDLLDIHLLNDRRKS